MRGLNPRQIEAFRAVVLTGGVGSAANLINVTQPAVSRMIRDLQRQLGLTLFERRGTGLVPTSEALSLYAEVERAFVGLERISQMATELRTRGAGFLRIAALPALANGFLPRFVGRFLADRPKLDVVLSGLVSHAVVAAVAQGQCDLGFAEASIEHAAVRHERMPAAPFVAVLPQDHRLTRKKRLRPKDFEGENFISLGHSSLSRFRVDRVFAEHGVNRILRIETPLSEIACSFAGSGAGVTLCEPFTATEYATRGIVVRPFEPRINFEFAALYAAQRTPPPVAREFIDSFKAHVTAFLRHPLPA
ncbi:DNA-binding transcriptional regulator, LysR family [Enhydrobacter aerosaccus]|uniref:DNA-binding transcriptional regulator, LysR family n=1 Tax=Enhydrobacter aerosaccus TaxID=225324 RepID=A0A1T4RKB7_9HYPH|nr:LysR family transcriptional regulator [Enhydrobacter aerosaccus]SKA16216.1 DNA-binding transcriptional regulator, LysR family [Enhydrobacter aerosaccus]